MTLHLNFSVPYRNGHEVSCTVGLQKINIDCTKLTYRSTRPKKIPDALRPDNCSQAPPATFGCHQDYHKSCNEPLTIQKCDNAKFSANFFNVFVYFLLYNRTLTAGAFKLYIRAFSYDWSRVGNRSTNLSDNIRQWSSFNCLKKIIKYKETDKFLTW